MKETEAIKKALTQGKLEKINTLCKRVDNCKCGYSPHIKLIESFEPDSIQKTIEITCDRCGMAVTHTWIPEDPEDVKGHMIETVLDWNAWVKQSRGDKK